ncbi:MAG TPA: hypothetical protein VFB66_22740 [Tepidisphaeraceae bacterium]|nr:hypothetical protein [Tepidisphaeraceae bacterium]
MARPSTAAAFNIAQLERLLQDRKTELTRLERQRQSLARKLDGIDRQIVKLGGSLRGGRRGNALRLGGLGIRARNDVSLVEAIETALRENGKPMKVGDIVAAVESKGYRSNSANFRGIVNQTLIKERKRFANPERATYALKSGGGGGGAAKKNEEAAA